MAARMPAARGLRRRASSSTPAARAASRASTALIAVRSRLWRLVFPAQIGAGDLRPHRPQRSRIVFQGVGADGWTRGRSPLPSASLATVRRGGAAKPLAGLDFGAGADGADDADGCAPAFSGVAEGRVW